MAPALALTAAPCPWSPRPVRPPFVFVPEEPAVRSSLRLCLVLVLFAGLLAFGPRSTGAQPGAAAADPWSHDHLPGELLVGFHTERLTGGGRAALPTAVFDRFLPENGVPQAAPAIGDGRTYRLRFRDRDDLGARQPALLHDP